MSTFFMRSEHLRYLYSMLKVMRYCREGLWHKTSISLPDFCRPEVYTPSSPLIPYNRFYALFYLMWKKDTGWTSRFLALRASRKGTSSSSGLDYPSSCQWRTLSYRDQGSRQDSGFPSDHNDYESFAFYQKDVRNLWVRLAEHGGIRRPVFDLLSRWSALINAKR